jgi:enterochelin esterase-like enzyme
VNKRKDWTDERLREVNDAVAKRPFAGLVVACPFTPSFKALPDRAQAVREYGEWLVSEVLPLARKEAKLTTTTASTAIDGCSMGGPFALDIFLAHPTTFGAVGVVQPAFGEHRAPSYAAALAEAVAKHGARPIHLLSSEGDSFREATKLLGRELEKRGVPRTLRIAPGPHDQPWLRESGSIEMLLFHERRA